MTNISLRPSTNHVSSVSLGANRTRHGSSLCSAGRSSPPGGYDEALALAIDLRDHAARSDASAEFSVRSAAMRAAAATARVLRPLEGRLTRHRAATKRMGTNRPRRDSPSRNGMQYQQLAWRKRMGIERTHAFAPARIPQAFRSGSSVRSRGTTRPSPRSRVAVPIRVPIGTTRGRLSSAGSPSHSSARCPAKTPRSRALCSRRSSTRSPAASPSRVARRGLTSSARSAVPAPGCDRTRAG